MPLEIGAGAPQGREHRRSLRGSAAFTDSGLERAAVASTIFHGMVGECGKEAWKWTASRDPYPQDSTKG
jgi:hypothetical protein